MAPLKQISCLDDFGNSSYKLDIHGTRYFFFFIVILLIVIHYVKGKGNYFIHAWLEHSYLINTETLTFTYTPTHPDTLQNIHRHTHIQTHIITKTCSHILWHTHIHTHTHTHTHTYSHRMKTEEIFFTLQNKYVIT